MAKVWVTKYALTRGLFEAEVTNLAETHVLQKGDWLQVRGAWAGLRYQKDAFDTLVEALAVAREMAAKRIGSLERQIEELRLLERTPRVSSLNKEDAK